MIKLPLAVDENIFSIQKMLKDQQDEIEVNFKEFLAAAEPLLKTVAEKIKIPIDNDLGLLPELMSEYSTISYTVGQYLSDAKTHLQIFQALHHTKKSQGLSEADRKLYTQTMTIRQTQIVSYLANAAEKLDKRVTIIQSIMKAETAKLMRGGSSDSDISYT